MRYGVMLALLSAIAFGATVPFVKLLGSSPFSTAALLYTGAALASLRSQKNEARVRGAHLGRLFAVALAGAFVAPVCLAWALAIGNAASVALLLNAEAFFTVLLGWRLHREPLGRRMLAALALVVAGGVVLAFARVDASFAAFLALVAALGWATDNALTRPLADLDPSAVTRYKSAIGAAISFVLALGTHAAFPSPLYAIGLLACGAIGYGLSLRLYLLAQRSIGAGRTGSIFGAAPFIGALVAVAMGEPATLSLLAGGLLFAAGVLLHVTEKHSHAHTHEAMEHEHLHRHDDGHHDHVHDPPFVGEHSHPHRHEPRTHAHAHGADLHHEHH